MQIYVARLNEGKGASTLIECLACESVSMTFSLTDRYLMATSDTGGMVSFFGVYGAHWSGLVVGCSSMCGGRFLLCVGRRCS